MWSMLANIDNKDGRQLLDSGPGNNWIVHGDEQQGYFGMVAARDFLHRPQIAGLLDDEIGFTAGDVELIWLKVAYKGKYLFFPRSAIKNNVSWNHLYLAGLVYGEKGPGLYPGYIDRKIGEYVENAAKEVDQYTLLSCKAHGKEWFFKVRLFHGYAQNPFKVGDPTTGSEWDDLMYRMTEKDPLIPNSGAYQAWPTYYFTSNTPICTIETNADKLTESGTRGTLSMTTPGVSNKVSFSDTQAYGRRWHPVLEMVEQIDVVFSPEGVYGGSEDLFVPPVIMKANVINGLENAEYVGGTFDVNDNLLTITLV